LNYKSKCKWESAHNKAINIERHTSFHTKLRKNSHELKTKS